MADLFTFPEFPRGRSAIPLFRTPFPGNRTKEAGRLAKVFGVTGKVNDEGTSLIVSDRRASLEVFQASNSLRWSTLHLMKSEDKYAAKLPDDEKAIILAKDYLRTHKVSSTNASVRNVTRSELSRLRP